MARPRRTDADQVKQDVLLGVMGGVPLTVIARRNGVSRRTVELWAERDAQFAEELAAARALGWDQLASECLEIADDTSEDTLVQPDGSLSPNGAAVLSRRLRIETRLRLLAKWDSGRYGDTKQVRLDANVEVTEVRRLAIDPRSLSPEQREALRGLLAVAEAQGLIEGEARLVDAGDDTDEGE